MNRDARFPRLRAERDRGEYAVRTVAPGTRDGAPHVLISVFARGLLDRLVTRAYLPDPSNDPVLASGWQVGLRRAAARVHCG